MIRSSDFIARQTMVLSYVKDLTHKVIYAKCNMQHGAHHDFGTQGSLLFTHFMK